MECLKTVFGDFLADSEKRSFSRFHTNIARIRYEATYEHHDDPTDGSKGTKRSLSAVMAYLASLGHDTADMWDSTVALVGRTAEAMAATLLGEEAAVPFAALWPPPEGWVGYDKGHLSAKQDTVSPLHRTAPQS